MVYALHFKLRRIQIAYNWVPVRIDCNDKPARMPIIPVDGAYGLTIA